MKKQPLLYFFPVAMLLVSLAFIPFKKDKRSTSLGLPASDQAVQKKIVFIAGACSHGPAEHEHKAGCRLLAKELDLKAAGSVETRVFEGWPTDSTELDNAAAVVLYMDGGPGHLALRHMQQMKQLMDKGVGLACLHYAVEVPKERGGAEFKEWLGGYFETHWSVNPTWTAAYKSIPKHQVTAGVKPFSLHDEWYYHMRFRDGMKGITPLLTAIPPPSTLDRRDGPHEGNVFVRKALGTPQHMAWLNTRPNGGRSFGFTGGHYHKNWADENVRRLVLNAILWTAKATVPAKGIPLSKLSEDDMSANLDKKPCR